MPDKQPTIYIMASKPDGAIYTGVTSDLPTRVWQHRTNATGSHTKKYNIHRLVYFDQCGDMYSAIAREKQIKKWGRRRKVDLIEKQNPEWRDLWEDIG